MRDQNQWYLFKEDKCHNMSASMSKKSSVSVLIEIINDLKQADGVAVIGI